LSTGRILVIASNPDLRKSLAFSLEAEGYTVTSHAIIPSTDAGRPYDCVVLDHKAAGGPRDVVLEFCNRARRVVLLAGAPQPWLAAKVFAVVQTPLSGGSLTSAVSAAIATTQAAPAPAA
jgi:hypothetical protein